MAVRIGTFNIENLLTRFDFTGFRNQLRGDRVLRLYQIANAADYQRMEEARMISLTDDTRQLTGLAIAEADADVLCLQEVESLEALNAFEHGYLYRMMGEGYRHKYLIEGNDSRGIDVALMARETTRAGEPIEIVGVKSHSDVTFDSMGLYDPALATTEKPHDRIFRRDCLEVDLKVGGRPLTVYAVHLKSMQSPRDLDGRLATMPVRSAETRAVRKIIEQRFGAGSAAGTKNFVICGDMNDYQERLVISGSPRLGFQFAPVEEVQSALDIFSGDGFAENLVRRRAPDNRWTLFHAQGLQVRHLSQLDYIWASPALSRANPQAVPEIIRKGQPYRTPFPPGQEVERFPRTGWDRPKASDHCPVVVELNIP